jgi:triacylglycerol lipase
MMTVLVRVMLSLFALPALAASGPTGAKETVVLLHGLGLGSWAMWRVEHTLAKEGYRVVNLTYPSRQLPLEQLATEWLPAALHAQGLPDSAPDARLHFVTHSMGGIVVRAWLREQTPPSHLGRVVMLAPPNQGTPLVDRMGHWKSFALMTGVNGRRLGMTAEALPNQLGPWPEGLELGVIAGDRPLLPWSGKWAGLPGDGKVPVARTHLQGEADHIVLPYSHTWIQYRRDTIEQVRLFLREGRFAPIQPVSVISAPRGRTGRFSPK